MIVESGAVVGATMCREQTAAAITINTTAHTASMPLTVTTVIILIGHVQRTRQRKLPTPPAGWIKHENAYVLDTTRVSSLWQGIEKVARTRSVIRKLPVASGILRQAVSSKTQLSNILRKNENEGHASASHNGNAQHARPRYDAELKCD